MTPEQQTLDRMQEIARAVDDIIPTGFGFITFVFPIGETKADAIGSGPRVNYVANCDRQSAVKAMREWIAKIDHDGNFGKHIEQ